MKKREFHPLELALSGGFLLAVYFLLFTQFSFFSVRSPTARSTYERAQLLVKRGKFSQALTYVEDLTKKFPTNHVYWTLQADLLRRLSRFQDEALALEKVMAYSSLPDEACPRIGQAYDESGDKVKMISSFKRCLELDPNNSDFHFFAGRGHEGLGELEEAQQRYETCLQRSPQYLDCSTGVARVHLRRGEPALALKILEDPTNAQKVGEDADALLSRAIARRRQGMKDQARDDLLKALEIAPTYVDVWNELGSLENSRGNRQPALEAFRKASDLQPGNQELRAKLESLEKAD